MSIDSKDNYISDKLIECRDDEVWDAFILSSPQCNAFSLSAFLAAQGTRQAKLFYEIDGKIVASVLLVEPEDSGFRAPSAYSLYQGVALAPIPGDARSVASKRLRITSSLAQALAQRYPHHSLCLHPSLTDLRGFQWCNFHTPDLGTYVLSLYYTGVISLGRYSTFAKYLETIRPSRRGELKKAVEFGVSVSVSDDVDSFLKLYQKTFTRQDIEVDVVSLEKVRRLVASLLHSGCGELRVATVGEGRIVSAVVAIFDPYSTYYLFGASDPEYRNTGAGTALVVNCVEASYSTGRMRFDMVGINSPKRGDFKTSFNADPEPYFALIFGKN